MLHGSGLNGQFSLQMSDTSGLLGPVASAKVLDCARLALCACGVCLPKRAVDAEPTAAGMGGSACAGGGRLMGRGQAVRRGTLNPVFEGSNPSAPINHLARLLVMFNWMLKSWVTWGYN